MKGWFRRFAPLILVAASVAFAGSPPEQTPVTDELPAHWKQWIDEEVYPLLTKDQRNAFMHLETEAQRNAYADRLWALWGRQTGAGPEFRMMYQERLRICREEFGRTTGDRAILLLIHGPPDTAFTPRCWEVFYPLEFWYWKNLENVGNNVVLLFYQSHSVGPWRLWNPFEGRRVLYTPNAAEQKSRSTSLIDAPERNCYDSDTVMRLLDNAQFWGPKALTMMTTAHLPTMDDGGPESISSRFKDFSAVVPDNAEPLEFSIAYEVLEIQGGKVLMAFTLTVPCRGLGRSVVGETEAVQVDVVGEISSGDHMVDRFRYLFTVPDPSDNLDILFERSIRPGDYTIRIKIEDVHSDRAGTEVVDLSTTPSVDADEPQHGNNPSHSSNSPEKNGTP